MPLVSVGQELGSTATSRVGRPLRPPAALSAMKGKATPANDEPPPQGAKMTSGQSPAFSNCFFAS
jgi:hypothetical protein